MERKYHHLADVYAAILKGEINIDEALVNVDGGSFGVYENGDQIFECSESEALEFVSDILGLTWQES